MGTSALLDMKERWIGWRNRLIADAGFRRWAARFPLSRPIARARARETFGLVAGFVYSQVLAACVAGGVLARLSAGPASTGEIADCAKLSMPAATRLLRAAAALHLAQEVAPDRWLLGRIGAAICADPGVLAMIRHHDMLYRDLADPLALLRSDGGGGALSAFWPYAQGQGGSVAPYSALMAASQPMVAEQAIAAYDFRRHRRMLDIGGGEGAFATTVQQVAPRLECAVFDLPQVVARITSAAITRIGGNFRDQPLPTGYDIVTLVRIAHDHDDAIVQDLLNSIRASLLAGARLLIVEPMAGPRGDAAMADAYFGMYLLAMGSGRARTPEKLTAMLRSAGFARVERRATPQPLIAQILVATA